MPTPHENAPPLSPSPSDSRDNVPETIDSDLVCRQCGYALRGLASADVCPECMLPIMVSARGTDDLDYAEPGWVATLARSTVWLLVWWISSVPLLVLSGAIWTQTSMSAYAYFIDALVAALAMIALWMASTSDPRAPMPAANVTLRVLAIAGVVSVVIDFTLDIWGLPLAENLLLASNAIDAAQVAMLFVVFARLARRLRDGQGLARTSRLLIWGNFVPALLAVTAFMVIGVLAPTGNVGPTVGPAAIVVLALLPIGCGGIIVTIVFWVWSIVALFRFRGALSAAAKRAAANWSGA